MDGAGHVPDRALPDVGELWFDAMGLAGNSSSHCGRFVDVAGYGNIGAEVEFL